MTDSPGGLPRRKDIAVRFLFSILFTAVFEIAKSAIQLAVLFQYIHLFITRRHNEPVRDFSNKAAAYAYRVMRYLALDENRRPFPLSPLPGAIEPPEETVRFP